MGIFFQYQRLYKIYFTKSKGEFISQIHLWYEKHISNFIEEFVNKVAQLWFSGFSSVNKILAVFK